ncbi:MAG: hypothetical protein J6X58_06895 [Bacteroidales bacterium]|nr:hypothetical protein [Bacteroidales bacterium]
MKKISLLLIAVAVAGIINAQEGIKIPSGYQGFLEQGPSVRLWDDGNTSVSFSTTHGFYFNSNTFIGIGVALEGGNDFFAMPIYTALKYNFCYSGKVTPTIQMRLGSYLSENTGAYADAAFGVRFGSSRDFAINLMLTASYFSKYKTVITEVYNTATHSYDQTFEEMHPSSIGLRIGIEW